VEVGRYQDENAANVVEEDPREQQRGKCGQEAGGAAQRTMARCRRGQAAQARRTDECILMLDDALAAIVVRAIRTAANRLAVRMMKTTLLGKCGDGWVLTA